MQQIICSTGALIGRPNGRDYRLLKGCAENLRCDCYEFMMYDSWYGQADELTRFLKDLNLPILSDDLRLPTGYLSGSVKTTYSTPDRI